jgi:hypothetical protein
LMVLVLSAGLVFSPEEKSRLLSKHCDCDYWLKKVLIHIHDVSHVETLLRNYTVIYTGYTFSLTTLWLLKKVPWVDPFNAPLQLLHLPQHTTLFFPSITKPFCSSSCMS